MKKLHLVILLSAFALLTFRASPALAFLGDDTSEGFGAALELCELPTDAAESVRDDVFCTAGFLNGLPAAADGSDRERSCRDTRNLCNRLANNFRQCHVLAIQSEAQLLKRSFPDRRREISAEQRECRRAASELASLERARRGLSPSSECSAGEFCIVCAQLETLCNSTPSQIETGCDEVGEPVDRCEDGDGELTEVFCPPNDDEFCVEALNDVDATCEAQ